MATTRHDTVVRQPPAYRQPAEPPPRVRTGLTNLDALLGDGLRPGQLTVIAARTAMGKSTLALSIARDCALRQGRPARVVSLEMSNAHLLHRVISAETGVLTEKVRQRELDETEQELVRSFAARDREHGRLLFLCGDSDTPTVADIERSCAAALQQHGRLDLLVVDSLGLMDGPLKVPPVHREAEVASIVADLHQLADRLKAAVVVVEQLSHAPLAGATGRRCGAVRMSSNGG
ncbi:DnaB-like helicase C-terminal domain-containing protein [Streptomyces sp. NPDC059816]|uniref:DnaB-like helicase C-terminal domain-containing protein n=1 Tax=Streptomyces sp. NPDC059816 TaxID=3346960 RepID=UPI0036485FB7